MKEYFFKKTSIFLTFFVLSYVLPLQNEEKNTAQFLSSFSLSNFSNIYQQKSNYQIFLKKNNEFQGNLNISNSKIILTCEEQCSLFTSNSLISLEESYFSMQNIIFNVSENNISKFNYLFNVKKNSTLSLKVNIFLSNLFINNICIRIVLFRIWMLDLQKSAIASYWWIQFISYQPNLI